MMSHKPDGISPAAVFTSRESGSIVAGCATGLAGKEGAEMNGAGGLQLGVGRSLEKHPRSRMFSLSSGGERNLNETWMRPTKIKGDGFRGKGLTRITRGIKTTPGIPGSVLVPPGTTDSVRPRSRS